MEADEEEGTVSSPAAPPESLVTKYPGVVVPECWWFSSEEGEEREKEEKEEKNETTDPTDPMPTLGSSRNSADPEVTTEPTDEDRCLRPLQRARERRAARLQEESDAHAVTNFDPHDSASQRSSASCDLEQDLSLIHI